MFPGPGPRWRRVGRIARLSLRLLASNRRRTLLGVGGLALGVATVMMMTAAGLGAERRLLRQVRAMGTDLLVIRPAPAPPVPGRPRQSTTLTTFRPADVDAIQEESRLARAAAGEVRRQLAVRWEGRTTTTTVSGSGVEGLALRNLVAARGRAFDGEEDRQRRRVALVGRSVVRALFGAIDPIGAEIRIEGVPFEVIGVLRARGVDAGGADLDQVVVIPLETALRRVVNVPWLDAIYVQASAPERLDGLEREVRALLAARHPVRTGSGDPWLVQNQAVLLRTERGTAQAMRRLVAGVTALALVIGGAGIVALSLLTMRERASEVGLRRALGARGMDIQTQFVVESAVLGLLGGVIGVAAGSTLAGLGALVGPWDLVLAWRPAALALVGSLALGLTVGTIPAARAARLDPVEALRRR